MGKIRLIIGREYLSRVRKKSFIIMTILGPLLIGGLLSLAVYLGMSEIKSYDVLLIDEYGYVPFKMKDTKYVRFHYTARNISDDQFKVSQFDLMVYVHEKVIQNTSIEVFHKGLPSGEVQRYIADQLARSLETFKLKDQGFDPELFQKVKTYVSLSLIDIESHEDDSGKEYLPFVGMGFGIIIFIFIFLYGVQVMRGVIEEKTSRIVEVLISSVTPFQLMLGKIVGIAFVGLTQFFMWIILTIGIITVLSAVSPDMYDPGTAASTLQVTPEVAQEFAEQNLAQMQGFNKVRELLFETINWVVMLSVFLFYFLFGYLLYAALFAAVGSAVDSETETQQFMLPVSLPLLFAYVLGYFFAQSPESTTATVFSIVPFTSPVTMMMRLPTLEKGDLWQLWLSMVLLILTFFLVTWIAGKIYRTGILMYGKKASYRELWKWLFYR